MQEGKFNVIIGESKSAEEGGPQVAGVSELQSHRGVVLNSHKNTAVEHH